MKTFKLKYFSFIIISFLFGQNVISQNRENSRQLIDYRKSYISISSNYNSDAVFMGRKDSVAAPYLYTTINYQNKIGVYVSGSFSLLTNTDEDKIDLYLFSVGYNFNKNKFFGDLSGSAYFFNESSYNVISKVIADLTAQFQYDFKFINLGAIASVYFTDNGGSDFFFTPQLSYDFITKNNKFQLSPTFSLKLGSQNFYQEYYSYSYNRIKTGGGSGSGNGSGTGSGNGTETGTDDDNYIIETITEVTFEESEKFGIMAYEVSLPIWFTSKSFTISFIPTYTFPQNGATILADESIVEEKLENTFYWLIGLNYKFRF
jgi:hypothetical protein